MKLLIFGKYFEKRFLLKFFISLDTLMSLTFLASRGIVRYRHISRLSVFFYGTTCFKKKMPQAPNVFMKKMSIPERKLDTPSIFI